MIGPQIPEHLRPAAESDSDDDYGPAPPPPSAAAIPAARSKTPDDSSDDDVGPLPAPSGPSRLPEVDPVAAFKEREERQRQKERDRLTGESSKPKRADWMLVPPKDSEVMSNLDPTKLKSRGFLTSGDAQKRKKTETSSLWTETPEERRQRIADEQSGKRKRVENADSAPMSVEEEDEARRKRKRDKELQRSVDEHNKQRRAETLLKLHGEKPDEAEDEAKPPRIWDRDSMLGSAARMDAHKRKQFIKNATGEEGLKGRFGSSGYA